MRAVKNAAVILAVCLIVVCGAFMPSIISNMQNHWLRLQTDTRDMELLSELDLSDPTVMDAFWLYSNPVSYTHLGRAGLKLNAETRTLLDHFGFFQDHFIHRRRHYSVSGSLGAFEGFSNAVVFPLCFY